MDILNKKLSEVTVEELLTYLDYHEDVGRSRRKQEVELGGQVGKYMDQLGILKRATSLGACPQSFTSAAEFHKWATTVTGAFAQDCRPRELVVITAWVDPHE